MIKVFKEFKSVKKDTPFLTFRYRHRI